MKKNVMFGLITLAVVGLALGSYAAAYKGDLSLKGPNHDEERHEAMETALESGDYYAWRALMDGNEGRHRVTEVVTEENFQTFVEMHNAIKDGDFETAKQLRAELGLDAGRNSQEKAGMKEGFRMGRRVQRGLDSENGECMRSCISQCGGFGKGQNTE